MDWSPSFLSSTSATLTRMRMLARFIHGDRLRFFFAAICWVLSESMTCGATAAGRWAELRPILEETCLDCHSADEPAGGLDLVRYFEHPEWMDDYRVWLTIRRRIAWGEMPPGDARPDTWTEELIQKMAAGIQEELRTAARREAPAYPPLPLRRLSRFAFGHSIRDILHIPLDVSQELPADGGGGEGFDNAAETLFVTPLHTEKYLLATRQAVEYAAKTAQARPHLFANLPGPDVSPHDAAKANLLPVAAKAFRRPIADDELSPYLGVFDQTFSTSSDFEQSILDALCAILLSPRFLFVWEPPSNNGLARELDQHELAARLALFLTASVPDEELAAAAAKDELSIPGGLRAQTQRLIKERAFRHFTEDFVSQWLGTRTLQGMHRPNSELFPDFDDELRAAFEEEPILFVEEVFRENKSLLTLIDGKFTFLNRRLARHYQIEHDPPLADRTLRVELPADSERGGLLTMAAVLTTTSYPHRTSPVLRGKWVLDNFLGAPPHPPPPNIPPLETPGVPETVGSLRAKLMAHRADPACAGCHKSMDAVGFGLETFDPIGRLRELESEAPNDTVSVLADGTALAGPSSVKNWLQTRQDDFIRNLVFRAFGYALGRGLTPGDYPDVEIAVDRLERNNYDAQELILAIAESKSFRHRAPSSNP
jgi:Protein of unknown function (DUF1592)/Protein of unknown function (DUF1588)/Protein of unknown function (DUF1585)/Protein of unknown function (DUF1587)/Protein of unknown function (DUF1595)/Planctomycete cytochrome C